MSEGVGTEGVGAKTHSYVCLCAVTHSYVRVRGTRTTLCLCHDAFICVHVCRDSLIYVRERYIDQFVFVT